MKHSLMFACASSRRLNEGSIKKSMDKMMSRFLNPTRVDRGWKCRYALTHEMIDDYNVYTATFTLVCKPLRERAESAMTGEWEQMLALARMAKMGEWRLSEIDGEEVEYKEATDTSVVPYAAVSLENLSYEETFAHIFGRADQINGCLRAIHAGIESDWKDRFHTVMWGEPASGKTEIAKTLYRHFGEEIGLWYDGTAVTAAGLIKDLKERVEAGCMPRLLFIEEIEKGNEEHWRPLLGLLDTRGEIKKLTARGFDCFSLNLCCIATVNNRAKFDTFLEGALSSRFSNPLWCPRPNAAEMEQILHRELKTLPDGGNPKWIKPALKFAEEMGKNDPRWITRVIKCGRDDLLTGKYQAEQRRCMPPAPQKRSVVA